MSADTLALVGSLVSLAGVAVGVLITIHPNELTRKRDYYQSIAKIWSIIQYDLLGIKTFCLHESKSIEEWLESDLVKKADSSKRGQFFEPTNIGHIVTTAWPIAISNGDFITVTDTKEIDTLAKIYAHIKMVNEEIDRYMAFRYHFGILTYEGGEHVHDRIRQHYKYIKSLHTEIATDIQNIEDTIDNEIKHYKHKDEDLKIILTILGWVGWITFIIFIIILLICLWWFAIGDTSANSSTTSQKQATKSPTAIVTRTKSPILKHYPT